MRMIRISEPMDWCELERLANDIGASRVYRKARCQHGKTRQQVCVSCEGGYATDHHTFAAGIGFVAEWRDVTCIAVSDDGEDVAYLPARFQTWIAKREPIELLLARSQPGQMGSFEQHVQKIVGRAYSMQKSMMMLSDKVTHHLTEDVDASAWADARLPGRKPSVRYIGDGSAWVTLYGEPMDLPSYHVYRRA